jgi:hypothetical protein
MQHNDTQRRVELYLRGDTYGTYDRQQAARERVAALEDEGIETEVDATWQRVRTPEQDTRDGALETYEEFREWAETNGYTLEPAFERRQRSYLGTDVVHDVVTFPVVSLAVYDGTDLEAVFPCSDESGDVHFTVQECLGAFENDEYDAWLQKFAPVTVDRTTPLLDVDAPSV